jgi:transposase
MNAPMFVRELSPEERAAIEEALRSKDSFTLRRAQIIRLSAAGQRPRKIASALGCAVQTVRNALHAFNERGLESLRAEKSGPKEPERLFDEMKRERLMALAHQSPRAFGKARSTWTLSLLAEVAFEAGLTEEVVSHETIRQAILALGSSWQRAKHWIQSPDPQYALKKSSGIA